jgi:ubiquinone/menaquinone biosynthesis C-methylase UbiE
MVWNSNWDKIFKKYDWGKYPSENLVRFVGNFFKNKKNNYKTLEIGCGIGANIWYLSKEKFKTYGIDGSNEALKIAKKRMKSESLNANFHCGDILNLPYKNNYFDLVIDVECLYSNNLFDTKLILSEINRVLKPKGLFFSQSFSTKTWGFGDGISLKNEKLTYTKINRGALKKENSIIRFLDLKSIKNTYSIFEIINIEKSSRTINNLENLIEEWIIICRKN